jgi:hypothetical protein
MIMAKRAMLFLWMAASIVATTACNEETISSFTSSPQITTLRPSLVEPLSSPTARVLPPPNFDIDKDCLTSLLATQAKLTGTLIVIGAKDYSENWHYWYDLNSRHKTTLQKSGSPFKSNRSNENEYIAAMPVSPNGKWIGYDERIYNHKDQVELFLGGTLTITDTAGKIMTTFRYNEDYGVPEWLSNDWVVFSNFPPGYSQDMSYFALDPFTEEQKVLPTNYPAFFANKDMPLDLWTNMTVYDPTLQRVIYPVDTLVYPDGGIALADVSSRQIIARPRLGVAYPPAWSPDGKYFVLPVIPPAYQGTKDALNELFLFDRNGKMLKQLTDFTAKTQRVVFEDFLDYKWSPDSKYISIWQWGFPLMILDVAKEQVINTCISPDSYNNGGTLVWSPDGQMFVVHVGHPKDPNQPGYMYLVDLTKGFVVQLDDTGLYPQGWVNKPSP